MVEIQAPSGEIKALTALRGIAALAVVLQHYSATAQHFTPVTIPSLAPHGYMAVDFFFVLSGFIMAYTYADGFRAKGWRAYPDFVGRRIARIWPLQVAVVLALLSADLLRVAFTHSAAIVNHPGWGWDIASNIFMLQGFGIGRNLNGPSGTVSQEMGAYALFPILLAAALHRRRSIALAAVTVSVAIVIWQATQEPRLNLVSRDITNNVVRCIAEFTMGLGAYRLYRRAGMPWLDANWLPVLLSCACVVSLLLRVDLPAALMFPLLIVAFARNQGWPAQLVASRGPYFLGLISYSLYLIHSPIRFAEAGWLGQWYPGPMHPLAALGFAALGAATTVPVAWLAYRWVEQPGRDWCRRLLHPRGSAIAAPAAPRTPAL